MGSAAIFSGNAIKLLKSILDFNGGPQILTGAVDPTSSATSAPKGSMYLNTGTGLVYVKQDAGSTTNWSTVSTNAPPSGLIAPYAGTAAPTGWLLCDNSAISRTTYSGLFAAIAISTTGNRTSASAVITNIPSTTAMTAGMYVSGTGIPAGAIINTVDSGTQITLSANASSTGTGGPIVVAPYGIGDGSTTFNVPDTRGVFLRGAGTQTISATNYSGTMGTKQRDQMQGHIHGITIEERTAAGVGPYLAAASGAVDNFYNGSTAAASTDGTNGTPRVGTETRPANLGVNYIIKT